MHGRQSGWRQDCGFDLKVQFTKRMELPEYIVFRKPGALEKELNTSLPY